MPEKQTAAQKLREQIEQETIDRLGDLGYLRTTPVTPESEPVEFVRVIRDTNGRIVGTVKTQIGGKKKNDA